MECDSCSWVSLLTVALIAVAVTCALFLPRIKQMIEYTRFETYCWHYQTALRAPLSASQSSFMNVSLYNIDITPQKADIGRGIRILTIDGGQFHYNTAAAMLMCLEKRLGTRFCDMFDLVLGTSVGGAIAAAALQRYNMHSFGNLGCLCVMQAVSDIWHKKFWGKRIKVLETMCMPCSMGCSRKPTKVIEKMWYTLFPPKLEIPETERIKQMPKVGIVATDITHALKPFLFTNYNSTQSHTTSFHIRHAVRAACSIPILLEDFKWKGRVLSDGGLLYNNPARLALLEARHLWPDLEVECLLSIGCGIVPPSIPADPTCCSNSCKCCTKHSKSFAAIFESIGETEQVHKTMRASIFGKLRRPRRYFRLNPLISPKLRNDPSVIDEKNMLVLARAGEKCFTNFELLHLGELEHLYGLLSRSEHVRNPPKVVLPRGALLHTYVQVRDGDEKRAIETRAP